MIEEKQIGIVAMQKTLVSLCVSTADCSFRKPMSRIYEWEDIEQAIEAVFEAGGSLNLAVEVEIIDRPGVFIEKDNISILSLPGRYVLTVFPARDGNKSRGLRYLWQANREGGQPESEMVEDIEFDTRFLCHDINLAKEICAEFFEAREITEKINALTVDESVPLGSQ